MGLFFSIIVPVFNRPNEIKELLASLKEQTYHSPFEIVLIEDGSTLDAQLVVSEYRSQLEITYLKKNNTGPGDSRNYGMSHAKGNYFIILDSDCILPATYLQTVADALELEFVDCFGGPDSSDSSFTNIQKAIDYAMTSFLTTGGIRGHKLAAKDFQPRSFNMGLSKEAFEQSGGFGRIHPGEDPDLSLRLNKLGFKTKLLPKAMVFHKRRIDFGKFFEQVKKFGMVRPIITSWHPNSAKISYWFPTLFCLGLLLAIFLTWKGIFIPLFAFGVFFSLVFIDALFKYSSLVVSFYALLAVLIQFIGYGYGFLISSILVTFSKKSPEDLFPHLFFKK